MPQLVVTGLNKTFGEGESLVHALSDIYLSVNKGEFLAIMGASGSGKTTLLNCISTIDKPDSGSIVFEDFDMIQAKESQLADYRAKNISYIFQSYNLLPTMNALDNVALPLVFRGVDVKKRIEIAKKYLTLVGLEKQIYQNGNAMSGGQQQRVGIARALAMQPKIIFADEPTGNLDTKTSAEVLELMKHIVKEENQTLIMVTHDNDIAKVADRQIRIVDGKAV